MLVGTKTNSKSTIAIPSATTIHCEEPGSIARNAESRLITVASTITIEMTGNVARHASLRRCRASACSTKAARKVARSDSTEARISSRCPSIAARTDAWRGSSSADCDSTNAFRARENSCVSRASPSRICSSCRRRSRGGSVSSRGPAIGISLGASSTGRDCSREERKLSARWNRASAGARTHEASPARNETRMQRASGPAPTATHSTARRLEP